MSSHVLISVINDVSGDQRIHRIASTLHEAGFKVTVIGRKLPDSPPLSKQLYDIDRMKLWFRKGKLFYLEYNFRLFWKLIRTQADILNANDLDTLLANYWASKWKKVSLIYDSHEYFTEVPELIDRKLTRGIWLYLERRIFPKLKSVYTVNQALANIYHEKYNVSVSVIRNLPIAKKIAISKEKSPILIYQGALNLGRGIELMIDAMQHLPNYQLWIVGRGDVEQALKAQIQNLGLQNRVIMKGFIPWKELSDLTQQAKLGLSLECDMGENYRNATPNKLYDYIQAKVPVLVSDLPGMREIVSKYQVGAILKENARTPLLLAKVIESLLAQPEQYRTWVTHCLWASEELNWEQEKEKLIEIYRNSISKD